MGPQSILAQAAVSNSRSKQNSPVDFLWEKHLKRQAQFLESEQNVDKNNIHSVVFHTNMQKCSLAMENYGKDLSAELSRRSGPSQVYPLDKTRQRELEGQESELDSLLKTHLSIVNLLVENAQYDSYTPSSSYDTERQIEGAKTSVSEPESLSSTLRRDVMRIPENIVDEVEQPPRDGLRLPKPLEISKTLPEEETAAIDPKENTKRKRQGAFVFADGVWSYDYRNLSNRHKTASAAVEDPSNGMRLARRSLLLSGDGQLLETPSQLSHEFPFSTGEVYRASLPLKNSVTGGSKTPKLDGWISEKLQPAGELPLFGPPTVSNMRRYKSAGELTDVSSNYKSFDSRLYHERSKRENANPGEESSIGWETLFCKMENNEAIIMELQTKVESLKDTSLDASLAYRQAVDANEQVSSQSNDRLGIESDSFPRAVNINPQRTINHEEETKKGKLERGGCSEDFEPVPQRFANMFARPIFLLLLVIGKCYDILVKWTVMAQSLLSDRILLPEGVKCIEWTCHCGYQSFEYMTEEYEDAVSTLAEELESSGAVRNASSIKFAVGGIRRLVQAIGNTSRDAKRFYWRVLSPQKLSQIPGISVQTPIGTPLQPLSEPPLWLLFCINGPDMAMLEHVDLRPVCSDNELFVNLRTAYLRLRTGVPRVRRWLTSLGNIHFVQFQLLPRTYVDGFEMNQLPPLTENSYEYRRVGLKPPVPIKWMLHLYNNPDHGSDHKLCLERFPKKKERLRFSSDEEIIGWGIYFTERVHRAMIVSIILVLSTFAGVVFGVLWGVLKHDVSAAFAVASFVTSVGALGLASWASWAVLT